MDDHGKQQNDFALEHKLRIRRRRALLPWVVVAGLALVNSSKFWDVLDKLLLGVG